MPKLVWDNYGDRRFEAGLDRGVLYTTNGVGVAWNGLTTVNEDSTGGEITSYYIDGVRYLNVSSREEFGGTIEALTYPNEFEYHDGTVRVLNGLIVPQQKRRPFSLSYRTRFGNDAAGIEGGYKLHIIYNAIAAPSNRVRQSLGDNVDPMKFSWAFSTVPKKPKAATQVAPLAHVIIDSTKVSKALMRFVEERLYGSIRRAPSLISLDELFYLFENPQFVFSIFANRVTGLSLLTSESDETGDLIGDEDLGYYRALSETRMVESNKPGLYTLKPLTYAALTEDVSDPGTYLRTGTIVVEDTNDPGTYVTAEAGLYEDPSDPGTYLNGV